MCKASRLANSGSRLFLIAAEFRRLGLESVGDNGTPEDNDSLEAVNARLGVPFSLDDHQVTDEAQYISYPDLARVSQMVRDAAVAIANMPERPRLSVPKPVNPHGVCTQQGASIMKERQRALIGSARDRGADFAQVDRAVRAMVISRFARR